MVVADRRSAIPRQDAGRLHCIVKNLMTDTVQSRSGDHLKRELETVSVDTLRFVAAFKIGSRYECSKGVVRLIAQKLSNVTVLQRLTL